LSPWLNSGGGDGKSDAREEKRFSKGQNVLLISPDGDFRQAHVLPGAENNAHPRPDHASDDAETYQYDQLRVTKKSDAYEVWLSKESSQQQQQGDQGGQQQTGASQGGQQQQPQQRQRNPGTAAVKVRIHKDGGITARVGKDDNAVRFSAHKDGAKLKYGKDHWLVVTKDGLIVSKEPEVGNDPIPDDNKYGASPMASTQDFEVLDPKAKDIGGVTVVTASGKRMVSLTRAQAQWFLDQGQIRPVGVAPQVTRQVAPAPAPKGN
jgi:hypothetical protein